MSLHSEVEKFKAWAAIYPRANEYGEWECAYENWPDLYAAALHVLEISKPEAWSEEISNDLLYAMARDNECEILIDKLAEIPSVLFELAKMAIHSQDPDAKWQLADRLGSLNSRQAEAETLLLGFVVDENEYVRRRALLSLGTLKSTKAEKFAVKAWDSNHEYQRMAALSVLEAISSAKLPEYIEKAMQDGREHLVHSALGIQHRMAHKP
jgi:HEAT repeat protein